MTTAISALPITQKVGWTGRGYVIPTADGAFTFNNAAGTNVATVTVGAAGALTFGGAINATNNIDLTNTTMSRASSVRFGANSATILQQDADNSLALRNGVSAQTFRVYNTYTDASNYEAGTFDWSSNANILTIGTVKAGTGSTRSINVVTGGALRLQVDASNVTSYNNLIFGNDNTNDIGASGATRPRNLFLAGSATIGGPLSANYVSTTTKTVAGLITAAGNAGNRSMVTDATVVASGNFGAIVAGGGANTVPVFCDGTNWRIG